MLLLSLPKRSAHLLAALALLVSACGPGEEAPLSGMGLSIRAPLAEHNPFADPHVAFVELTAEGPDLVEGQAQRVLPYSPGAHLDLPAVPYGFQRQIRVGLWPRNEANGQVDNPLLAVGRSIPVDLSYDDVKGSGARPLFPYVTKVNTFAPAIGESGQAAATDARIGATAERMPDHSVMIIGGGTAKADAKDPWDPKSYTAFSDKLLQYDPNLRAIGDLSLTLGAFLSKGRAFHASALGVGGLVAIAGGYVLEAGAAVVTNEVEFFDPTKRTVSTSLGATPHMKYRRVGHTITRMFDNDNYFLIVGGKGPDPEAPVSWEIWHPFKGFQAEGQLANARWNHTAIRLPETDGGFVMLIGGESGDVNNPKVLNNFEVIRYDTRGNVSRVGNKLVTCKVGGKNFNAPPGDIQGYDKCPSLAGQPGYQQVTWEPFVQPLNLSVARTLAGATYVPHGLYHYIYVAGGFADAKHTQPLDRIDVFDIQQGIWVAHDLKLETARGAPMMDVSMVGPRKGQVLVAGGVGAGGKSVDSGEMIYYAEPEKAGQLRRFTVKNKLPAGGVVAGTAVGLSTGHVMVVGGSALSDAGMTAQQTLQLWNPL